MDEGYSIEYRRAIALLAQRMLDAKALMLIALDLRDQSLWDTAVAANPRLNDIAKQVEDDLDYELSFNQCCNAINWVFRYQPEDWAHLLENIKDNDLEDA